MMRSMWSGMISFGLVNIPVKLYTAVETKQSEMNYLRRDDLCPIQFKKVCRNTGEEVSMKDIVRGYEYSKGDFVILDDEDFEKANVKKSYTIDIEAFVDESEIELKYVEKPFYLEPEKKSYKTYALFLEAMKKTKKVGVGKFVLKDREHLVMLKPQGDIIMLLQLRFMETIRSTEKLDLPKNEKIPENQLNLAVELINKMEGKFKPEEYRDTYADTLKEIVEAKKAKKTVHIKKEEVQITESDDILAQLKKSLHTIKK